MKATQVMNCLAATILAGTTLIVAAPAGAQTAAVSPRSDDTSGLDRSTEMRLWLAEGRTTERTATEIAISADVYVTFDGVNLVPWEEGRLFYGREAQRARSTREPMPTSLRELSTKWIDAEYAAAFTLELDPNVRGDILAMAAKGRVGVLFLRTELLKGEPIEAAGGGEQPQFTDCYDLSYPNCGGGSCPPNSICVAVNIRGFLQFCACFGLGFEFSLLGVDGACPGPVIIYWEQATPNANAGLLFARSIGGFVIPGGPCAGTSLLLTPNQLQLVTTFSTGSQGSGRISGQAGQAACGGYLQMVVVDGQPCGTSNAALIR